MLVKRFRGRVVQKMRRIDDCIELIFLSKRVQMPRERRLVTQAEWDRHGSETYEKGRSLTDLRTPATKGRVA